MESSDDRKPKGFFTHPTGQQRTCVVVVVVTCVHALDAWTDGLPLHCIKLRGGLDEVDHRIARYHNRICREYGELSLHCRINCAITVTLVTLQLSLLRSTSTPTSSRLCLDPKLQFFFYHIYLLYTHNFLIPSSLILIKI